MGILDSPLASVASTVLSALGGSGTLHRPASDNDYDADTGLVTGSGPTDIPCAVGPGPAAIELFDEALIEKNDAVAIVSRTEVGAKPKPSSWTLTWKGVKWRIIHVTPYTTGDADAAYALLLRV